MTNSQIDFEEMLDDMLSQKMSMDTAREFVIIAGTIDAHRRADVLRGQSIGYIAQDDMAGFELVAHNALMLSYALAERDALDGDEPSRPEPLGIARR